MGDKLRINCCNFSEGLRFRNYLYRLLHQMYELEVSEDPEILLYGPFGQEFLRYKCLRVYYTGENTRPNLKQCDYAFGFDYSTNPRHFRFPDYAAYVNLDSLVAKVDAQCIAESKSAFCCFIYSNPLPQERIRFFQALSRYKRVDSFGRVLNNMSDAVRGDRYATDWQDTKLRWMSRYKFAIVFENESYPGYVTEKLAHAMLSNCIPIYWGSPLIHRDFNARSFINCHAYRSFDDVVDRVIAIDTDDDLYRQILGEPWYENNQVPTMVKEETIVSRLRQIVDAKHQIVPVAQQGLRSSNREIRSSQFGKRTGLESLVYRVRMRYAWRRYVEPYRHQH